MRHWLIFTALFLPLAIPFWAHADDPAPAKEPPDSVSANDTKNQDDAYKAVAEFMNVIHILRENYIDPDKATYDKLIKGAMKGMLQELDPYSIYESREHYKNTMDETRGEFGGLGIVITTQNNALEVVAPMEDTPGFRAGILPGDIIIEIDGKSARNMDLNDCVKLLKGPPGTKVDLTIFRKNDGTTKKITVERAMINVSPVKGAKIIDDGIGYVRITQFSAPTAEKLDEALKKLKKDGGLKALILDLRGNPGGLMSSAIQVCSRFIKKGELVVYTEARDDKEKREFRSMDCDKTTDIPMAVLVNGHSASASEIVAGCLKDQRRAVIIGEKTFGKAYIQTILPLPDGGAARFTTGQYFTPAKRSIHKTGVAPDIVIAPPQADEIKLAAQRSAWPGVIKPDTPGSVTDTQLQRAVEILKGICLFSSEK
jgi:carboxyl-terminal processing protease